RYRVRATFFIRGQFIRGHVHFLRQELREGHALANHSFSHPHFPSSGELTRTTALIRRATGYTPCLFRAPYGDVDGALLARAWRAHMITIQWSVDSLDSLGADTGTVRSHVIGLVRSGSIVLMHDGEGSHEATIGALSSILRALRARHYRFVTVPELLGLAPV